MRSADATVAPTWTPNPQSTRRAAITAFRHKLEEEHGIHLDDYAALQQWSVDHLDQFWLAVWTFFDVQADGVPTQVLTTSDLPGATWFPGIRLNLVDQIFRSREPTTTAVTEVKENGDSASLTWSELEGDVAAVATTLRGLGVGPGDRVAGYLPNCSATLIVFLATASLGAIWSCCGQDYAASAAANRLAQLEPVTLICADGYYFAGREHDRREEAVRLAGLLPTVRSVLHVRHLGLDPMTFSVPVVEWGDALAPATVEPLAPTLVPFDHPLWVLYSSGTTGVPKGLVHGHGGVVLESLKTMTLQFDLTSDDRIFWHTTTNWMMWTILVSGLIAGNSVIAYDGSPSHPQQDQLWRISAEHRATLLGASPGYLQACERSGAHPANDHALHGLRMVGATGSPVPPAVSFWIRDQFGGRIPLVSISGGTDVVAALATWAPTVPTWPGEMSCAPLGVAVDSFDGAGEPVRNEVGELVITKPMPTMPVCLWNDPDGTRYRAAYFDTYPGVWRHGDWVTMTDRGSIVIHGRSDATLNRHGVRLGSADIYAVVEALPGIADSLVVGIDRPDGRYWMPLFVVLRDGFSLDDAMRTTLADAIRREASPRHVPDEIIAVSAIPRTRTGKKLEVPIKRILLGAQPADVLSLSAVDDPRALDAFIALAHAGVTNTSRPAGARPAASTAATTAKV